MAAVNEGKILVVADVAELPHKPAPARSPAGDRTATVKARVVALQVELIKLEATAAGHTARTCGRQTRSQGSGGPAGGRISGLASEAVVASHGGLKVTFSLPVVAIAVGLTNQWR
jgi:hypothetical protein